MSDLNGAPWRKSSHSGSGNTCVEVAGLAEVGFGVRDSTNPSGPTLVFSQAAWRTLSTAIKDGAFNLQ